MKIVESIASVRSQLEDFGGKSIGFVPTMGFLHKGHLSLVEQSKKENDLTVVSIFVNPTQFAPNEDFDKYPRDLERDRELLEQLGVDYLFFPKAAEMYPPGFLTGVKVDRLGELLCGKSRQTHFQGVTTVVLKLLNIVKPNKAYFGRKDAQQAVIIKKMVTDLNLDVTIRTIPIIRDEDGLALSSRNIYLSSREREAALHLSRSLHNVRQLIGRGVLEVDRIKEEILGVLKKDPLLKPEYIEIVSLDLLEDFTEPAGKAQIAPGNTLIALAARVGKTRLIDNFILGEI